MNSWKELILMDDKKSNLLNRSNPVEPNTTYNRSNLYSVAADNVKKPAKKIESEAKRGKRTSVSCFQDTKNKLQSLITIMNTKNVDDVIDKLIDSYLEVMSDDETNEFRLITKSLNKRTIKIK